ncbi:MAG TPA: hypothetical protein PK694_03640 [Rhodospirillales bacterium]|nr:hypothetical protein [Rhodospirillales bacterium]
MTREQGVEAADLRLQACPGETEQDDADVAQPLPKDELAKVLIGNNQNPLLSARNFQHLFVRQTGIVFLRDSRDIVTKIAKV